MDPTHTSEAPRTRGMKLQMEQPGKSELLAPPGRCRLELLQTWRLPTGRPSLASHSQFCPAPWREKGLLSLAWGHRTVSATREEWAPRNSAWAFWERGVGCQPTAHLSVLEPTATNPSMHLCPGLESSFLSRIHHGPVPEPPCPSPKIILLQLEDPPPPSPRNPVS